MSSTFYFQCYKAVQITINLTYSCLPNYIDFPRRLCSDISVADSQADDFIIWLWGLLSVLCPLLAGGWALNRKELKLIQTIGKGEFGGEELNFQWSRHRLTWSIWAIITETRADFGISYWVFTLSASFCRCDGRRLQRDQGGSQVYQKRCHSAGVHRWGLCHDVRPCISTFILHTTCEILACPL